jgi:ABC-type transporter Mla MlaB component
MKFIGKIKGVQLIDSSMVLSSVKVVGHMGDHYCTIIIEADQKQVKGIVDVYGISEKDVPIKIGNGEGF